MTVKQLIEKLLNATLGDEIKLYDEELNVFHDIVFVNITPSARGRGEVHIEFSSPQ